jgi:trimethylamine--corrinoid protein Co-methyltransferase
MLGACGPTSSKSIDFQTGQDKGISSILAAVSGASVVNVHGGISVELTYHPVQSVLDDDLAGAVGRFIQGVGVDHATLAVDVIQEVGPIPGHFLGTKHTREWWKKEHYMPQVADRLSYPEWLKQGKKSALDYAAERVEHILATHKPTNPLTEDEECQLDKILEEAKEYYRKQDLL